jgi:hypothetical protein
MGKLKDKLLKEAKVTDEDKRKAALDAAAYAFRILTLANEFKGLRKRHMAIGGKQFKKAEDMLRKVGDFLEDASKHMG